MQPRKEETRGRQAAGGPADGAGRTRRPRDRRLFPRGLQNRTASPSTRREGKEGQEEVSSPARSVRFWSIMAGRDALAGLHFAVNDARRLAGGRFGRL